MSNGGQVLLYISLVVLQSGTMCLGSLELSSYAESNNWKCLTLTYTQVERYTFALPLCCIENGPQEDCHHSHYRWTQPPGMAHMYITSSYIHTHVVICIGILCTQYVCTYMLKWGVHHWKMFSVVTVNNVHKQIVYLPFSLLILPPSLPPFSLLHLTDNLQQAQSWPSEEGVWAKHSVWLWDCGHHDHQQPQALSVC